MFGSASHNTETNDSLGEAEFLTDGNLNSNDSSTPDQDNTETAEEALDQNESNLQNDNFRLNKRIEF